MHVDEAKLFRQCDAEWSAMIPEGDRAKRCARCATLVHDLSSMTEDAARATLRSERFCIRYLSDGDGNVIFGPPPRDAIVVPAAALLSKQSRRRWLAIASVAALPVLLEACGPGDAPVVKTEDAGTDEDDDGGDARATFERAEAGLNDGDAR